MRLMRKFFNWLQAWIPYVWATALVTIITFGSIGISFKLIEWVLTLLGVL